VVDHAAVLYKNARLSRSVKKSDVPRFGNVGHHLSANHLIPDRDSRSASFNNCNVRFGR